MNFLTKNRSSAGNEYFKQLSKEVAIFLDSYLKKDDGMEMISTVDLYCVFNRVRGVGMHFLLDAP